MIKTRFVLIMLLFFAAHLSYGQLEAANWYFGNNAGLNFNPTTGNVTALTNGAMSTNEGCASISDSDGNLLFYTDGSTVYNRNHLPMQNGFGLRGNASSTQSAIIIPKPNDPDTYYIFTVDTDSGQAGGNDSGLHYYEVDITANSGLGAVTTNIAAPNNLLPACSEKITAINDPVNDDILVVAYGPDNSGFPTYNTFHTFRVTSAGVDPDPVSSVQPARTSDRRGNLKLSPDGRFLVSCNFTSASYIYDYDRSTGIVSNERFIPLPFPNVSAYGVEFSPNSSLMYLTASNNAGGGNSFSSLYQFDLTATDIPNSGLELDSRPGYRGALQLGIDGKIYRALAVSFTQGVGFLGRINNPDVRGNGAGYEHNAVSLAGRFSTQGLPPFIQSFFALIDVENLCLGDLTEFSFETDNIPTAVEWEFGDGATSNTQDATHTYTAAGAYDVVLRITVGPTTRIYRKSIEIYDTPIVNPASDVFACDTNLDGSETFDFAPTTNEILGNQDPAVFEVLYYNSQSDADMDLRPITLPISIDVPQVTLYARIQNARNGECFETTSFQVNFYDQPIANPVADLEACDDNFDGIETFNLTSQNSGILDTQNPANFTISYHLDANDATLDQNPLPNSYRNTTPFQQTIFARIENNNQIACIDVTDFDLIVQERPEAVTFTGFQCDEDGTADNLTNFNLSSFDATISNNASDVKVSYYLNQNDANNDVSRLDDRDYRNVTATQNIVARVTNEITGCFNTAIVTLQVSASDAQNATLELCDDDGVEDGFHVFTLSSADNQVLTSAPANVTVSYYLSANDALSEQNPLPNQYTNTTTNNQVIFARAESPDGNCYGISEVELIVNELPQVVPTDFVEYCGNNPQPLTIDAGPLPGATTDYNYQWSNGETTYNIDVRDGGDYTVVVTNNNGCTSERVVTVVISEPATIDDVETINANGGTFGSATAVVSGLGDYEFRIDPNAAYQDNPTFENLEPGFYVFYVNDKNGCGETTARFSIVGYPRFFTPNGDGFNDLWQLDGVNNVFEPDATIYIFDRFGKLLKQLLPSELGWDGTFNGEPLPSSDYWFRATLTDGTEFSANFTLKR